MDEIEQENHFWKRIRFKFEPFRRFYQGNAVIRFHYNTVCTIYLYRNRFGCIENKRHQSSEWVEYRTD